MLIPKSHLPNNDQWQINNLHFKIYELFVDFKKTVVVSITRVLLMFGIRHYMVRKLSIIHNKFCISTHHFAFFQLK